MLKLDPVRDALVVIDVQRDFCEGGALAAQDADAVLSPIDRLTTRFTHVVAAQDWHPADHSSFAANHPGAAPYSTIDMPYGPQTLWPVHCVQGSPGAEFHPGFVVGRAGAIVRKGMRKSIDSYSALFENDRATPTGLGGYLRERGVSRVFVVGLATDFCVSFSALDARQLGFEACVLIDACRGVDLNGSMATARAAWAAAGVVVAESDDLA